MPGGFHVRPVRIEDAEAIADIRRQPIVMEFNNLLQTDRIAKTTAMLEGLTPDNHMLVAEADGQVVAYARLDVMGGGQRHVGNVACNVHDAFQGRGIGRAMMETLLDLADNHLGLARVQLEVWVDNARAIGLYEKLGFEAEGRKRKVVLRRGEYVDVLVMGRLR